MRHIPLHIGGRPLLHAAETFDQFEGLLWFFESLDDKLIDDWWEKIASDIEQAETKDNRLSTPYDDNSVLDRSDQEIMQQENRYPEETPMELDIAKNTLTIGTPNREMSFVVESDMQSIQRKQVLGKESRQDYVEVIAAQYPLLGMAIIDNNSLASIEQIALKAIKISLDHRKVHDWVYLSVFLAIIQHAKKWDRTNSSGFWAYVCEQFGYKYSPQLYDVLTNSVKEACIRYSRLFLTDLSGDNNYYSTVLAHSIAPSKSFFALCDFLTKFYSNNLDYSFYEDDPSIGRMIRVLSDRCQGETIEPDADIQGSVGGIQVGLRMLIIKRPGFSKQLLTRILRRIGSLISGEDQPCKDYIDLLVGQWYANKLSEPTSRGTSVHKRTTEIAYTYDKIRVEYILDENNEPALRIPSTRLTSRENPILFIYSNSEKVFHHTIDIYGNDYSATSEETIIPISWIPHAELQRINAEIIIDGKRIYNSGSKLCSEVLLFKGRKLNIDKSLDEGNYTLFASKSINISFQGNIQRQRRTYFSQLFDIYVQGEASIFINGKLIFFSRQSYDIVRFSIPRTKLEYVVGDNSYPLFSRDCFKLNAIGIINDKRFLAITQSGENLHVINREENQCQFSLPERNGQYIITLKDENTGKILDEVRFYIADRCSFAFDKDYYLESVEEGYVSLDIEGMHFESSLKGFSSKVKIQYNDGDIHIQIPRVRFLLDNNLISYDAIWKGDISPYSNLNIICPDTVNISLRFNDTILARRSAIGGFEYTLGNVVQAYDGSKNRVPVELIVENEIVHVFDIFFKMSFTGPPRLSLVKNTLIWLNSYSFIGERTTILKFVFHPTEGKSIIVETKRGIRVLAENFPSISERYRYQVIAQTETSFGSSEAMLTEGSVIFGDVAAVIFRDVTLCIERVIVEGDYIDIKHVYVENICYIGMENLGYTDLSGEYAHYTAVLYYYSRDGKVYFTEFNPVDIYLVNEKSGIVHISFHDGEGLLVYKNNEHGSELYKYVDPPKRMMNYFVFPDFFEFQYIKEK